MIIIGSITTIVPLQSLEFYFCSILIVVSFISFRGYGRINNNAENYFKSLAIPADADNYTKHIIEEEQNRINDTFNLQ